MNLQEQKTPLYQFFKILVYLCIVTSSLLIEGQSYLTTSVFFAATIGAAFLLQNYLWSNEYLFSDYEKSYHKKLTKEWLFYFGQLLPNQDSDIKEQKELTNIAVSRNHILIRLLGFLAIGIYGYLVFKQPQLSFRWTSLLYFCVMFVVLYSTHINHFILTLGFSLFIVLISLWSSLEKPTILYFLYLGLFVTTLQLYKWTYFEWLQKYKLNKEVERKYNSYLVEAGKNVLIFVAILFIFDIVVPSFHKKDKDKSENEKMVDQFREFVDKKAKQIEKNLQQKMVEQGKSKIISRKGQFEKGGTKLEITLSGKTKVAPETVAELNVKEKLKMADQFGVSTNDLNKLIENQQLSERDLAAIQSTIGHQKLKGVPKDFRSLKGSKKRQLSESDRLRIRNKVSGYQFDSRDLDKKREAFFKKIKQNRSHRMEKKISEETLIPRDILQKIKSDKGLERLDRVAVDNYLKEQLILEEKAFLKNRKYNNRDAQFGMKRLREKFDFNGEDLRNVRQGVGLSKKRWAKLIKDRNRKSLLEKYGVNGKGEGAKSEAPQVEYGEGQLPVAKADGENNGKGSTDTNSGAQLNVKSQDAAKKDKEKDKKVGSEFNKRPRNEMKPESQEKTPKKASTREERIDQMKQEFQESLDSAWKYLKILLTLIVGGFLIKFIFNMGERPDPKKVKKAKLTKEQKDRIEYELARLDKIKLPPNEEVIRTYEVLLRVLANSDLPRKDFVPPKKYEKIFSTAFPELSNEMFRVTEVFCDTCYGRYDVGPEELQNFRDSAQSIIQKFK